MTRVAWHCSLHAMAAPLPNSSVPTSSGLILVDDEDDTVAKVQDSDDEFLQEILCCPRHSSATAILDDTVSDDDFLQDLLRTPTGTIPGTLQMLREGTANNGGVSCPARCSEGVVQQAVVEAA